MGFFERFMPRRQGRIEAVFVRNVETAKAAQGASFLEVCKAAAQSAALALLKIRKDRALSNPLDQSNPLDGIEPDVLLFEAAAWFMASVQTYVLQAPEVPNETRPHLTKWYDLVRSDLGTLLEVEGGLPAGRSRLGQRIDAYPQHVQEAISFLWAALMEDRGLRVPTAQVRGSSQPMNFADGLLLPALVGAYATSYLKVILDLMKQVTGAMKQATDSAAADSGEPPVTPMEALAAQVTDDVVAEEVRKGTRKSYWMAFTYLTLSRSYQALRRLRGNPDLREVLSHNNPAVVLYNLAALLLRRTEELLERNTEERLTQQVTDVASVVGRLFKEYSEFDKADEAFPYRRLIFRGDVGDDSRWVRALARALVANAGHPTPQPVGPLRQEDATGPGTISEAIRAALAGDEFLPAFCVQAAEYARKLEELIDREQDDEGTEEDA